MTVTVLDVLWLVAPASVAVLRIFTESSSVGMLQEDDDFRLFFLSVELCLGV